MLRNQSQFQISNTRERLEKSYHTQNEEMFPSRIVPLVSTYIITEFYYDSQSRLLLNLFKNLGGFEYHSGCFNNSRKMLLHESE